MTPIQSLIYAISIKDNEKLLAIIKEYSIDLSYKFLGQYGETIIEASINSNNVEALYLLIKQGFEIEKYSHEIFNTYVQWFDLPLLEALKEKKWFGQNALESFLDNYTFKIYQHIQRWEVFEFLIQEKIPHIMHEHHPLFNIDLKTYHYLLDNNFDYWFNEEKWQSKIHKKFQSFPYGIHQEEKEKLIKKDYSFLYSFNELLEFNFQSLSLCSIEVIHELFNLAPHEMKKIFSQLTSDSLFLFDHEVVKFILETIKPAVEYESFHHVSFREKKPQNYLNNFIYLYQNHYELLQPIKWSRYYLAASNTYQKKINPFLDILNLNDLNELLFDFLNTSNYASVYHEVIDYIYLKNGIDEKEIAIFNAIKEKKSSREIKKLIQKTKPRLQIAKGFILALSIFYKRHHLSQYLLNFIVPHKYHLNLCITHDNYYVYDLCRKKMQPNDIKIIYQNQIFSVSNKNFFNQLIIDSKNIDWAKISLSLYSSNPINDYIFEYISHQMQYSYQNNVHALDIFLRDLFQQKKLPHYIYEMINVLETEIHKKQNSSPYSKNNSYQLLYVEISDIFEKNLHLTNLLLKKGLINIDRFHLDCSNLVLDNYNLEELKELIQYIDNDILKQFFILLIEYETTKTCSFNLNNTHDLNVLFKTLNKAKEFNHPLLAQKIQDFIFYSIFIQRQFKPQDLEHHILKELYSLIHSFTDIDFIAQYNLHLEKMQLENLILMTQNEPLNHIKKTKKI